MRFNTINLYSGKCIYVRTNTRGGVRAICISHIAPQKLTPDVESLVLRAGQFPQTRLAEILRHVISLTLTRNGSFLNREQNLKNVVKELGSIIYDYMCNLHVILLSKITQRHFTPTIKRLVRL